MKPGWLILAALIAGMVLGWISKGHTTDDRYIRALAEKHEAVTRYWDVKTNDIITNNTLETERRKKK